MLRRLSCLLLAAAVLLALPAAASARACRGSDVPATARTLPTVRHALVCLHNRARAAHGLHRLAASGRLERAAAGHARRMVYGRFFSHVAPSGSQAMDRVRRAGYALGRHGMVGENIGWGAGATATARSIVAAWLASSQHRAILLNPRYRAIGIGISPGTPRAPAPGAATFAVDLATR